MIEVVIPAYNAAPFLRDALRSVAEQSVRPAVVSVVDDSSTDDTADITRACAKEFSGAIEIQLLRNAGPRGPSAARNTAIRASGADYIALLDADDLLAPAHHEILLNALGAAKDSVLAFGDSTVFNEAGILVDHFLAKSGVAQLPAVTLAPGCDTIGDAMYGALLRHGVFGTSACLFKRSAALGAGLFDESMMYCEDTDFFLRLSLLGRFVFAREVVAHKRVHGDNLSQDRNKLAFCRGTAVSLARLATRADEVMLTPVQKSALRKALIVALDGYLYNASCDSLSAYWDAAKLAYRAGLAPLALRPRGLVRLGLRGH